MQINRLLIQMRLSVKRIKSGMMASVLMKDFCQRSQQLETLVMHLRTMQRDERG